jgi:hypothetical protein
MEITIHFDQPTNHEASAYLDELHDILEHDYDLSVKRIRKDLESGVKDAGLTIALSIIGVSISAVGTIISALSYWKSQHANYSISLKSGNTSISVDNVEPAQIQEVITTLKAEASKAETYVTISET